MSKLPPPQSSTTTRRQFLNTAGASALGLTLLRPQLVFGAEANSKINLGLIGCGERCKWVTRFFRQHGGYNVSAVADYFQDRVEAMGELCGVPPARRFTGLACYQRLLEQNLDAVAIHSPPYFHPEQAAAAVDAGKHVYLAKPAAVDVPGCLSIESSGKRATEKKLAFLVDFQCRTVPLFQQFVQSIRDGGIGQIVSSEAAYLTGLVFAVQDAARRADPKNPELRLRSWATDRALSGDVITEQNIHPIDLATWMLGAAPLRAYGTGGKRRDFVGDCWDHFTIVFHLPNKVILSFNSKQVGFGFDDNILLCRVYGTTGSVDASWDGQSTLKSKEDILQGKITNLYASGAEANVATFHKNVTEGAYANPSVASTVRSNLTTILGRMAAYQGAEITWEKMLNTGEHWTADLPGFESVNPSNEHGPANVAMAKPAQCRRKARRAAGSLRFIAGILIAGYAAGPPAAGGAAPEVTIAFPADAGWPRDPSKITRNGPNDFTVDPDGHDRYVMVEIINSNPVPQRVTLQGFTNNFAHTKHAKNVPPPPGDEAYLYVQLPGGPWQRVYAQEVRAGYPFGPWIIDAPPGRTRVSTVVSFTCQEYLDYVQSLPDADRRITKEVVLTSGSGRFKTYRVRVSNPDSQNTNKLKIAFCKTSHAYEKSGFFMAQGVIAWLLSGDPAANLDHIEWSVYPCLDPQATYDGMNYNEQAELVVDNGRKRGTANNNSGALWNPKDGELPARHYHVLTDMHMYELRDWASYKYNDPFAPSGLKGNGQSEIERALYAFWPCWYEFGIDNYECENKWQTANALPQNYGGALLTHLEIPFYGKDDVDARQRLREQGRLWARSHSQAYLRMQRDHHYWTETSAGGAVNVAGAVILPLPHITLLEAMPPSSGKASPRTNAAGQPMRLYHEIYEHGVGMKAGESVTYEVPPDANTFRAMAGMDDGNQSGGETIQFVALDGRKELWRSRKLKRGDRELVFIGVNQVPRLTLRAEGPSGLLANWGGAKFTSHDPETP